MMKEFVQAYLSDTRSAVSFFQSELCKQNIAMKNTERAKLTEK